MPGATAWLDAPLPNSSIEQWRMVVIVTLYALFVTSQYDVIYTFANQRFGEVCWHSMQHAYYSTPVFFKRGCESFLEGSRVDVLWTQLYYIWFLRVFLWGRWVIVGRGVTREAEKGVQFPGCWITVGVAEWLEGASKSPNNVTHTSFNTVNFGSERPQVRTWGAKLASCPGSYLTSLHPW